MHITLLFLEEMKSITIFTIILASTLGDNVEVAVIRQRTDCYILAVRLLHNIVEKINGIN
jgi:hypothetical protein